VTERVIAAAQEGLRVLTKQKELGQVGGADLYTQQAVLAQAQATMPTLRKQLAQQRDLLAALTGRLPDQPPAEMFSLADLHLPADLPVSLPSAIVAQRPDIRQAAENARAASAQIGVAIANRIPAISLTANLGSSPGSIDKLFTSGNGFFSLAGSITQPIFQGGTLLHRQRAAEAAFDQAQAQYRSAVQTGMQNVADALHAVATDGDAVAANLAAERAAAAGLQVVMTQLRLGAVSYLAVVTAETTDLNAALALAQARANRLADAAALVQALGGGWWNRSDVQ
jgi:NodT family efflux transporter outer membrane factor (OMF) lipoprotein